MPQMRRFRVVQTRSIEVSVAPVEAWNAPGDALEAAQRELSDAWTVNAIEIVKVD